MAELSGQAGDDFQISPAMIEAGVYAAKEHCLGEGLQALVFSVFLAMRTEELDSKRPRVINEPLKMGNKQLADS